MQAGSGDVSARESEGGSKAGRKRYFIVVAEEIEDDSHDTMWCGGKPTARSMLEAQGCIVYEVDHSVLSNLEDCILKECGPKDGSLM